MAVPSSVRLSLLTMAALPRRASALGACKLLNSIAPTSTNWTAKCYCTTAENRPEPEKPLGSRRGSRHMPSEMSCWQAHFYGGPDALRLSHTRQLPLVKGPRDVLVQVHAASVNPFDTRVLEGYGASVFHWTRKLTGQLFGGTSEFPLITGMDFSGVVMETGKLVPHSMCAPGDEVWGTLQFNGHGSHAQYTVASLGGLSRKPSSLSHTEAAAIPYAAATTWSALTCMPLGVNADNATGKRILILGGSGGVGTFAIQLLKAWGADVTVVCGTDSQEQVLNLGADVALDYKKYDVREELKQLPSFDVVYDLVGRGQYDYTMDFLKEYKGAIYVSIIHPILRNFDNYGMPFGGVKTAVDLGSNLAKTLPKGRRFYWGFYQPSSKCMSAVAELVDKGKIQPVIEKVYSFETLPEAFKQVGPVRNKGKIIVNIEHPLEL